MTYNRTSKKYKFWNRNSGLSLVLKIEFLVLPQKFHVRFWSCRWMLLSKSVLWIICSSTLSAKTVWLEVNISANCLCFQTMLLKSEKAKNDIYESRMNLIVYWKDHSDQIFMKKLQKMCFPAFCSMGRHPKVWFI